MIDFFRDRQKVTFKFYKGGGNWEDVTSVLYDGKIIGIVDKTEKNFISQCGWLNNITKDKPSDMYRELFDTVDKTLV